MRIKTVPVGPFGKLSYVGTRKLGDNTYLHQFIFFLEENVWKSMNEIGFETFGATAHCYHPEDSNNLRVFLSRKTKKDVQDPNRYAYSVARKLSHFINQNLEVCALYRSMMRS